MSATPARFILLVLLGTGCVLASVHALAFVLPPTCATVGPLPPDRSAVKVLRKKLESLEDSDPEAAVRLMCVTIPRVEKEYGRDSLELALWEQALATPLIAYMDKHAEAVPLLQFAAPILERRLGVNSSEVAEIHVAYAWMYFRQGRLAEAGGEWSRALQIRARVPGARQVELQKVLVGLAQVQLAQRKFAAAQHSLERAQDILVRNGETVSDAAAAIENALVNIFVREEDYAAARRHAEAQVRIELQLQKQGGAAQLVPVYALLGQILERLNEFEASEQALRNAVFYAESRNGPPQRLQLRALTQLSVLLNERGHPTEALAFGTRALRMGEQQVGPDAPALVLPLLNLANIERSLGDLPQALHLYERAGRIVEAHPKDVEQPVLVDFYRGRGSLEVSLGDLDRAHATLLSGLQAAGDARDLSTVRAGILTALAQVSLPADPVESQARLREALGLYRARLPDSHPTILRVVNQLCGAEIETNPVSAPDCDEAARRLQSASETDPSLRHDIYENAGVRDEQLARTQDAYSVAIQSLAAAAALGTPDPLWRAQFQLARALYRRSQPTLATFFGKQSIEQIERLRSYFSGADRRLDRGFLRDKVDVYRTVADWLMEAGRIDEGLEVLKLLKSEELYDFALRDAAAGTAAGARTAPGAGDVVGLTSSEQLLAAGYATALGVDTGAGAEIDRLSRLQADGRLSPTEQQRLSQLLEGQRQAEGDRSRRLRSFLAAGSAQESPAPTARPHTIQAARLQSQLTRLGPDTTLVVYLLTESRLRMLIATRTGQTAVELPVSEAQLRRDIGHFLEAIANRQDVTPAAHGLYTTLLQPVDQIAARARSRHLVLWVDGALRYVPFAALHDGKRYLAEKYTIQLLSAIEGGPAEAAVRTPLQVRGLGVTQSVAGFGALPGVADELCDLVRGPIEGLATRSSECPQPGSGQGVLPGAGFADSAFTEARFDALMKGPREFSLLHLGTHFSLRPGNALRSFLVLGDGSRLTLDRIGGLDFSGIGLVTLSACQTGTGGAITDDGREVEGLSAIVQRRGAREVLSSLWRVEDASTALLMHDFYGSLAARPRDAPGALQSAQRALLASRRAEYRNPYYWAGFVLSTRLP
jgi:CHAT domain-containing protein/tetratricopeptide (TPR) repeat protein